MKSEQQLNSLALETRRMWGEDGYSPIDIFAIVNGLRDMKITVLKYPLSERISGMCSKVDDDFVICINSSTSYGRQRFTLAHEFYHILYEDIEGQVICNMSMGDDKPDSEREADIFASYLLMPYDALYQISKRNHDTWNLESVIHVEQFYQVSHMAILFRLEKDGFINSESASEFREITVSRFAALLGYGKELYQPSPENKRYFTTGEYIRKVEELANKGVISNGKKEELLLDGYRADIVYNLDEEEGNLND
ncbi:Zn-dependent peptidase ImmA, M78 family [Pseudobutyrivibrio sp. YE44]|uniref:ImmA/IrrE family metallo-endopeptidase n=1 Tax=Pseudobutyrivibrio sp. YE44 TaxID=1520802 RepID=UPI0008818BC9|nr:ImmA/IrrE family metallo-endopeptidase [Pseudobutyrivibrio sp. YE44]SDB54511.1 Zn-dependent peptidase ImmA, M78 family [Pseudobutyrivibrio sp. YE44]